MDARARNLAEMLARHIAEASCRSLSNADIAAAKMSLIDTIGVALAARGAPGTEAVLSVCRSEGADGRSLIWTTGERSSARQAGFVNSVFGAALDYDGVYHEGIVHADIIVVPTAIAVAESAGCSGQELLAAIAIGNDVLCRLSRGTKPPRKGWFFSSVYGVLVSAGITAKLLGADEEGILQAMGLASLNAAGTYQPMAERSMSKRALAAFAVHAGIHCGQLGAAGFEGVRAGIDGQHGIFALYNDSDPSMVVDGLGERFLGAEIGRKPYPSCQCNHAPIEAAIVLRHAHGITGADVDDVEVLLSPHACEVVGAAFDPERLSQTAAQFSVQYSVACALVKGAVGLAEIQPPAISDPAIVALASRVRVVEDPGNPHAYVPATVRVRLRGGEVVSKTVTGNRGAADLPLSSVEMLEKFGDCLRAGFPGLGGEAVARVFSGLECLHRVPSVGEAMAEVSGEWLRG